MDHSYSDTYHLLWSSYKGLRGITFASWHMGSVTKLFRDCNVKKTTSVIMGLGMRLAVGEVVADWSGI